jgi:hypothetical protein
MVFIREDNSFKKPLTFSMTRFGSRFNDGLTFSAVTVEVKLDAFH